MKLSPRSIRVASLIQAHLPLVIREHFTPNQIGHLTITAVEVSGDLSVADVFCCSIGGGTDLIQTLSRKRSVLTRSLTKRIDLPRSITLRFKPDQSVQHVDTMDKHFRV